MIHLTKTRMPKNFWATRKLATNTLSNQKHIEKLDPNLAVG